VADLGLKPVDILRKHCANWGLELTWVDSGEKLLAELDTGRLPDFIALGCDLADGAGIDLAHRLRERSEWTEIPLVMLCQGESPAEPEELQQLGIRRVLRKPLSPRTLQLELAALLGKDLRPQQRPRNTQQDRKSVV